MQHFIFWYDVAVQNIALFGKRLIDKLCIHTQLCRYIFNAKYRKLQFIVIFDFFTCLIPSFKNQFVKIVYFNNLIFYLNMGIIYVQTCIFYVIIVLY